MKEPPLRTRLLGHPLVGLPITGASMLTVYGWTQDSQAAPFALVMLAATGAVAKASTTMTEYSLSVEGFTTSSN